MSKVKIDEIFKCLTEGGYGFDKMSAMNQIKMQLFLLFMGICTSRYKWQGLPEEMPSWCVEKVLNFYGQGVIFKEGNEYLITSAVNSASLNVYGEPCEVQPVAINGMAFDVKQVRDTMLKVGADYEVKPKNAVLIKNNMYSIPTYFLIKPFIERLCFIWESAGINAGLSRVVALVYCNKDVSSTVRAEINKIMGGTKSGIAIVGEKTNILDQIEKVDLKVDYKPDLYWQDFDNTFNMLCQCVGLTTDMNKSKKVIEID